MKKRISIIILLLASGSLESCVSNSTKNRRTKHFNVFKSKKAEAEYFKSYDNTLRYWPIPFEEVNVKTTFGNAHIIVSGPKTAPTLILLHGLNASSTMWYPNVEAFSKQFRTYAIDFILEPGKSKPLEGNMTKDEIVQWYQEIFDHFKFKNISIVGASKGGWLALQLALKSKTKINKIVLLSPAQALKAIKVKRKVFDNITFALFPKRARLRSVLETLSTNVDHLNQAFINQFYIASKHAKVNKGLFQMTPFSDDEFKSLKIPVMILIGDHDIINDEKGLDRAKKTIRNVDADIIPGTGHFLSFDKPSVINKRVVEFLSNDNQ
jgi:pimeloyl-ACP methyl ester carboxylesterase